MHRKTPSPSPRTDLPTDRSPTMLKVNNVIPDKNAENSPLSPPPISTAVGPSKYFQEGATPRAQTRQEVELLEGEKLRKPRSSSSLEDIPEAHDPEIILEEDLNHESFPEDETISPSKTLSSLPPESEEDIKALKTALDECWTLCNTLAGLSSNHRERIFNFAYTGNIQEQAWKTCWKLCQKLYDSRDDDHETHVRPTLDLCRNFCQALFDVRRRDNEIADSVLRVSFELNNHLYNTHDRNLPEAFRERTLDFYITLCHRLMKQRSILAEETDSLLRACWSLAEMLFSLRQNKRDGKPQDEELLGSAVQACWELCDLFREGWTQVRPERGTPRPSQTTFPNAYGSGSSQKQRNDLEPLDEQNPHEPETPTTIFEDTALSPDADELSPPPNILVLGTDSQQRPPGPRWSSNASTLSGYSANSAETSSTATTTAVPPSAHQPNHHNSQLSAATSPPLATSPYSTNLKLLIFKVALNSGFQRSSNQSLQTFVKTLSPTAFGSQPWQVSLLDAYRKMIMSDRAFRTPIEVPSRRASASEVSRAVTWLLGTTGGSQHGFLRELFRLVFGFTVDEGERRGNVFIQT
ncbi:MAG: hypothetical protein M1833_003723 [Piccolia ochrophora]|nr:MAG: hypothetical protein M1833_003723 [Piccolia ochrophora]